MTGPTVAIALLRDLQVEERLKTLTVWEGIVNDPLGAVLAVSVYQMAASGQTERGWSTQEQRFCGPSEAGQGGFARGCFLD